MLPAEWKLFPGDANRMRCIQWNLSRRWLGMRQQHVRTFVPGGYQWRSGGQYRRPVGRDQRWGGNGIADINHDGVVNTADLLLVINNWGPCL
jgi:hypothetical protein